jgi:hypothetical protein
MPHVRWLPVGADRRRCHSYFNTASIPQNKVVAGELSQASDELCRYANRIAKIHIPTSAESGL